MTLERFRSAGTALLCFAVALFLAVLPDPGGAQGSNGVTIVSAQSPAPHALQSQDRHVDARRTVHGPKPGSGRDLDDGPALLPLAPALVHVASAPVAPVVAAGTIQQPLRWRIAAQPRAPPLA